MPEYRIRLVAEAGTDPVDGTPRGRDEETLAVEGESLWAARSRSLHRMTLQPMGRLLRVYDAETGDEIARPQPAELRPGRFLLDGLDGVYDGFTRGETWNGFAVPYFSLAEARRVADDYAAQLPTADGQTRAEYDAGRGVFRLYDPSSDEWDEVAPVIVGDRTLYCVGTHLWTWENASDEAAAPFMPGVQTPI